VGIVVCTNALLSHAEGWEARRVDVPNSITDTVGEPT